MASHDHGPTSRPSHDSVYRVFYQQAAELPNRVQLEERMWLEARHWSRSTFECQRPAGPMPEWRGKVIAENETNGPLIYPQEWERLKKLFGIVYFFRKDESTKKTRKNHDLTSNFISKSCKTFESRLMCYPGYWHFFYTVFSYPSTRFRLMVKSGFRHFVKRKKKRKNNEKIVTCYSRVYTNVNTSVFAPIMKLVRSTRSWLTSLGPSHSHLENCKTLRNRDYSDSRTWKQTWFRAVASTVTRK